MIKRFSSWYSSQDSLIQFLFNCGTIAILYFVVYRTMLDLIPNFQSSKDALRDQHINNVLFSAQKILSLFNIESTVNTLKHHILLNNGYRVTMQPYCSGLMLSAATAGFILAFPANKYYIRCIVASISFMLIFVLNASRISIIAYQLNTNNNTTIQFVHTYHKTLYDPIVYAIVLVYIAWYVLKFSVNDKNIQ